MIVELYINNIDGRRLYTTGRASKHDVGIRNIDVWDTRLKNRVAIEECYDHLYDVPIGRKIQNVVLPDGKKYSVEGSGNPEKMEWLVFHLFMMNEYVLCIDDNGELIWMKNTRCSNPKVFSSAEEAVYFLDSIDKLPPEIPYEPDIHN